MRPIPASSDASRGICNENRPIPQQRARFSPQVPAYPIPLNDCSLVLPSLSEYGKGERGRAWNDGDRGGLAGPLATGSTQTGRSARGATGSPPATARHSMSAPRDFWMVLQKMGPNFDTSLGFWAVCCGRGSLQTSPTWGNAGSSRPFKPKPPAKPPRSSEQDCTMRKPALPMQSTCASIRANRPNPQHEAPARTLGTESPKRTARWMKTL